MNDPTDQRSYDLKRELILNTTSHLVLLLLLVLVLLFLAPTVFMTYEDFPSKWPPCAQLLFETTRPLRNPFVIFLVVVFPIADALVYRWFRTTARRGYAMAWTSSVTAFLTLLIIWYGGLVVGGLTWLAEWSRQTPVQ